MTINNIPKEVYKYFNKKYEPAFAQSNFYINTFSNIRLGEDGIIFDNTEGIVNNICVDLDIQDSNDPQYKEALDYWGSCGFIRLEGNNKLKITNSSFDIHLDSYIYCVTTKRNDIYWENVPEDQGGPYDRCIKTTNFPEFSQQLFYKLNELKKISLNRL